MTETEKLQKYLAEGNNAGWSSFYLAIRECANRVFSATSTREHEGFIACRFLADGLEVFFRKDDAVSAAKQGRLKEFLETEIAIARMSQ